MQLPEGIKFVRFLFCDTGNIIRGKASGMASLSERLQSGIGIVKGALSTNMLDQMQTSTGYGANGEVRLVPDLATLKTLPYCQGSAAVLCDLVQLDHEPWSHCPRSILKRQIQKYEQDGIRFEAAFEPEFYLGHFENEIFIPIDRGNCFSSESMNQAFNFINQLSSSLEAQGMIVEQYYPELGHGQHELSIRHAPALQAADNHIYFRETLRGVAAEQNLIASLAAKPILKSAGSGCHLHVSAWNINTNENLFFQSSGLSSFGRSFVAGIFNHLPSLLAITCPSVNSYRRLKPKAWSSAYTSWGYENREAAIRVPSTYWQREMETTNLEIKCVDGSANPYLALAAVIGAGMSGVQAQLEPPEPLQGDPEELDAEQAALCQIKRLPESLSEALEHLRKDHVLTEILGLEYSNTFIAVRESESNYFAEHSAEEEIKLHLGKY
ncbi:MAG: glutamine synthetase family protein [Candidatus Obscuribacterales bacterium]|nr:glutamine synthetase family protein [Candidatus Obscuribacterales bacterium]